MKPPMIPHQGRGVETPNFRNVKESQSVEIGAAKAKGVPLDSGLATPMERLQIPSKSSTALRFIMTVMTITRANTSFSRRNRTGRNGGVCFK